MRILVFGGTRFLGRHFVEEALRRGHAVTVLTRGRVANPWPGRVEALTGDRDPALGTGLAALAGRAFDAAIDTSGYVPRVVGASAREISDRAGRYLFVSSISVLASAREPGQDESAAVAPLDDPATEDVPRHYGALKAACEDVVRQALGPRATIVRPGLIVGPYDATDRFGYWVARFVHPGLLGDRAARAVVPAPPSRPVQLVDARDLAAFMLGLVERDLGGTFNACSPDGRWTMGDVVQACRGAAADPPEPAWVDDDLLAAHHVEPWVGLPLWIPASQAEDAGFMRIDSSRAQAAGLSTRPLDRTVADTAGWLAARDNAGAWKQVLDPGRERLILDAFDRGGGTRPG
jgi:2'-hydroxyisoflavone reductase